MFHGIGFDHSATGMSGNMLFENACMKAEQSVPLGYPFGIEV